MHSACGSRAPPGGGSLRAACVQERAHQHPPTPGIVDVNEPTGPIGIRSLSHDRLRNAIGLQPELAQPRDPPAGQIEDSVSAAPNAVEVVTLDGHWPFRFASTAFPMPFRRRADPR